MTQVTTLHRIMHWSAYFSCPLWRLRLKISGTGAYYVQSFYWVKSGSGRIELSIVGHDNNAEFIFKYGHATLSTSPSVSLGGLSLSFSSGIDTFTPSTGAVYGGRATIK